MQDLPLREISRRGQGETDLDLGHLDTQLIIVYVHVKRRDRRYKREEKRREGVDAE
jgi:hypothetical protein